MKHPIDNLAERRILTYDDVVAAVPGASAEPLAPVDAYDKSIESRYIKTDMVAITGPMIFVRDQVARMLADASKRLAPTGLRLRVVYGYRHPAVQREYFDRRRAELRDQNPDMADGELDRLTHNFVAVPDVAGHPTGGAVDLMLIDPNGHPLAMGTDIADYADPGLICTFDPRITGRTLENRLLLHDAMVMAGFAPFYGEWWHFSYGDRKWAAFYDKKTALYGAFDSQKN